MRITDAVGYSEPRESIASDWSNYMLLAFPESQFIFIPNIENHVEAYIEELKINVLILSGGDDIGVFNRRDNTERIALKYALEHNIPVIAICRGMQLVHTFFGGKLINGNIDFSKIHRAQKHHIVIDGNVKEVNSYHTNYLEKTSISSKFEIFAECKEDESVEGIHNDKILAMMWHPERDDKIVNWNLELIRKFLSNEK